MPPDDPATVESSSQQSSTAVSLGLRSCVACRRRKVRCDKTFPCKNCVRHGVTCVFPPPGRARPKPRTRVAQHILNRDSGSKFVSDLTTAFILNERLDNYQADDQSRLDESILGREQWIERWWYLGGGFSKCLYRDGAKPVTRALHFEEDAICEYTSRLSELSHMIKLHNVDQNYSDDHSEESPTPLDASTFNSVTRVPLEQPVSLESHGFVLGCNPTNSNLSSRHPSPSQIPFFWQTFVENVDPLIKIFHSPTTGKVVRGIQGRMGALTPAEEALVFSIYFAAVISMTPDEVRKFLGEDKTTIATQFRHSTEQALAQAQFMTSMDLMTLQAFVLFVSCLSQNEEPRLAWNLTALAVRIAQSIGVQQPDPQLPPYEIEVRRRLWLCLWLLDLKTSISLEADWLIDDNHRSMEPPLNINDSDLDILSAEFPVAKTGMTDMAHVLVNYEIGCVVKKVRFRQGNRHQESRNDEEKESLVALCEKHIEVKYLGRCTIDNPLEWLTATNAKLFFATVVIFIHHPVLSSELRCSISGDVRDRLLAACIETVKCLHILETMATPHRRGWLFGTYLHWHAVAFILESLLHRSLESDITEKLWHAVELALGLWTAIPVTQQLVGPWPALMELVKKAKAIRQSGLDTNCHENSVREGGIPNTERTRAETKLIHHQHVGTTPSIPSDVQNSIGSMRHELHSLPDNVIEHPDPEFGMLGTNHCVQLEAPPTTSGPQAFNGQPMDAHDHAMGEFADNPAMSEGSFSTNAVFSAAWSFGHPPTQDLAWGAGDTLTDNSVDNTTEHWMTWNDMVDDLEG
ncbi:hypothetical protein FSHL1_012893 [Fusarium sambucinum]